MASGGDKKTPPALGADAIVRVPLGHTGLTQISGAEADAKARKHSWQSLDGSHIIVRSDYSKGKKLKAASAAAFFECIAVEAFSCDKKKSHIAQHLILPEAKVEANGLRPYFVANWMLPTYAPNPLALWSSNVEDGPGWNLVCVYRLTEAGRKALVAGATPGAKLVRSFLLSVDGDPIRDRLKAIARLANLDEAPLNALVRRVVQTYNNTLPWMTRPQQRFYRGEQYFECSFDAHCYRYPARKVLHVFHPSIGDHVFDLAFVIETDKENEMPEHIFGSTRFLRMDQSKATRSLADVCAHLKAAGGAPAAAIAAAQAAAAAHAAAKASGLEPPSPASGVKLSGAALAAAAAGPAAGAGAEPEVTAAEAAVAAEIAALDAADGKAGSDKAVSNAAAGAGAGATAAAGAGADASANEGAGTGGSDSSDGKKKKKKKKAHKH